MHRRSLRFILICLAASVFVGAVRAQVPPLAGRISRASSSANDSARSTDSTQARRVPSADDTTGVNTDQPQFSPINVPLPLASDDTTAALTSAPLREPQPVSDEEILASIPVLRQDAINRRSGGDLAGAEEVYDRMLRLDTKNTEARIDRAYARAWQHKYNAARDDFQMVLRNDPNNLSALNGLGYTNAWSGNYKWAEEEFRAALKIVPGQPDAERGLAYTALWSGDGDEAVKRFSKLWEEYPNDPEIAVGLGQSYLRAGSSRKARAAFEEALELDPNNQAAINGIKAADQAKPLMEFTLWGGLTWFTSITDVGDNPQGGIRLGEIAVNAMPNLRLWFQYDNGLGMDNLVLSREARGFPAFYIGGFYNYSPMFTSRLELGWRDLPGQTGQRLIRAEQVAMFPNRYVAKAGAFIGPRDDDRIEWIAYGAVGIPVQENFKVEPTFFYSRSGLPAQHQWRLLVSGEYFLKDGMILGGGIAGGQEKVFDGSSGIYDVFFRITAPLKGRNTLHALVKRESASEHEAITIISVGYTLGIEGL